MRAVTDLYLQENEAPGRNLTNRSREDLSTKLTTMLVVEPKAQRSESAPGYAIGHASSSTGPRVLVKAWGVALLLYAFVVAANSSSSGTTPSIITQASR